MLVGSIVDTLVSAAYIFGDRHHANSEAHSHKQRMKLGKVAFAFIQGTGLDVMIKHYKLDYNAEEIREKFYFIFRIPKRD